MLIRWTPPFLLTVWLWASVPLARPASEFLRSRGMLVPSLTLLGLIIFIWMLRFEARIGVTWRRRLIQWVVVALYGVGMRYGVVAPEERLHFLQISVLSFLIYRALSTTPENKRIFWAATLACIVGVVEEVIQIWVPKRFFDPRDMGISAVAALLSSVWLRWVGHPRQIRESQLHGYPG